MNQPGPHTKPLQCRITRQRIGLLKSSDQFVLELQVPTHHCSQAVVLGGLIPQSQSRPHMEFVPGVRTNMHSCQCCQKPLLKPRLSQVPSLPAHGSMISCGMRPAALCQ